ncbi:MAG TPA: hypothetical protein VJ836_00950 [Candidatus Saccharimonadales bacterium]|nr:hypothetical protein [Candidatus Saccharimonadales bacterium]
MPPFLVNRDSVDQPTVNADSDVEIADFRSADCAAVPGLVRHLYFYVFAVAPNLYLIEDIGHRFHRVGIDALAKVFLGRNELDAHLLELILGHHRVQRIAEGARPHVDDDILYVLLFNDALHHLTEDWPLGDCLS